MASLIGISRFIPAASGGAIGHVNHRLEKLKKDLQKTLHFNSLLKRADKLFSNTRQTAWL